ncbi:hypothetical protein [Rhodopirellula sallentina]|uniref:Putative membrane protein n=1 Tax=Rhodopirellula sallentina SM41 TaxID=1263870 RepID=M5U9M8_9BACT|nr:hypothetical protein [Rhodopirellula sallentina]EMI58125.1 putative membrane protein [Rhodopirellula sallentina SM41]
MPRSPRIEKRLAAKRSYDSKPIFRRSRTIEAVLGTSCVAALIILEIASQIGLLAGKELIGKAMTVLCGVTLLAVTICILVLCVLTLTGPIYKPQLDFSTGDLETYGPIDKFAALVIASLIIGVAGYVGYHYVAPVG